MNIIQIPTGAGEQWLSFRDRVTVIEAYRIDEVVKSLILIEELVEKQKLHAAGFISYEAAPAFDPSIRTYPAGHFPLLWFGIYREPKPIRLPAPATGYRVFPWEPSVRNEEYEENINIIKEHIARGDTYQVNYTYRLNTVFPGNPFKLFLNMNISQRAEYGAFIDTGRYKICSASPELFYHQDGEDIRCRPMKGTVARGRSSQEDSLQADRLYHSGKNRAENLMIVDMIRNDLGRIAHTGSVRVERLFEIERYPTVFQMTSSVAAKTDASFPDIISALFPCASVTGAPRIRTMEIINALESTPRRIYTGCIGYISPERKSQFNVAIRTVLIDSDTGRAEYGVGGGIVWDSRAEDEFAECRVKTAILLTPQPEFSLLETILWTPEIGYSLIEQHLERLEKSAAYFAFNLNPEKVRLKLKQHARLLPPCRHKIRLLVTREGGITIEKIRLKNSGSFHRPLRIKLSGSPIDSSDPFLYHKTTYRRVYEKARSECPDCDDVLLWNEAGEITETSVANVVMERAGRLITPPINSGLLPGTTRSALLNQKKIREEVITIREIHPGDKFFLINSVRGWREAILTD